MANLITINAAAERLSVSKSTLRRWLGSRLTLVRLGDRMPRVLADEIDQLAAHGLNMPDRETHFTARRCRVLSQKEKYPWQK
jgi:excisionase family DNA binding protein